MKLKLLKFIINWIVAWADMISGLMSVVTFTLYRPWWDFKTRLFLDKYALKIKADQVKKRYYWKKHHLKYIGEKSNER